MLRVCVCVCVPQRWFLPPHAMQFVCLHRRKRQMIVLQRAEVRHGEWRAAAFF